MLSKNLSVFPWYYVFYSAVILSLKGTKKNKISNSEQLQKLCDSQNYFWPEPLYGGHVVSLFQSLFNTCS